MREQKAVAVVPLPPGNLALPYLLPAQQDLGCEGGGELGADNPRVRHRMGTV